jgi:DNA-binding CsgD family transcriptional regulator
LTAAELRVLELLKDGRTYEEVAHETGRAVSTVRSQLHSAYHRLGVSTSYQAVLECVRAGWLSWSSEDPAQTILLRIEDLLRELVDVADAHYREEVEALTTTQRHYLEAFDARVRARTPTEVMRSQNTMDRAFGSLLEQAGVSRPNRQRPQHIVDRLISVVDGELERAAA